MNFSDSLNELKQIFKTKSCKLNRKTETNERNIFVCCEVFDCLVSLYLTFFIIINSNTQQMIQKITKFYSNNCLRISKSKMPVATLAFKLSTPLPSGISMTLFAGIRFTSTGSSSLVGVSDCCVTNFIKSSA